MLEQELYHVRVVLRECDPYTGFKTMDFPHAIDAGINDREICYITGKSGEIWMIPRERVHYIQVTKVEEEKTND